MSHESLLLSALATLSNNEHQQYDDTVWCHGLDHSHHCMYPCIIPFHLSLTSLFVTLSTFTVLWRHNLHQHDDVFHGLHHITMSQYHAVFSSSRPPRGKSTQIQTQKHNCKKMHKYLNAHIQIRTTQHSVFPISYPPRRKKNQIQKDGLHHLIPPPSVKLKATTWKKYTNTKRKTQIQKNTQMQKHGLHHLIPSVNRSSRPPRGKSTRPATHSQSDNQTT